MFNRPKQIGDHVSRALLFVVTAAAISPVMTLPTFCADKNTPCLDPRGNTSGVHRRPSRCQLLFGAPGRAVFSTLPAHFSLRRHADGSAKTAKRRGLDEQIVALGDFHATSSLWQPLTANRSRICRSGFHSAEVLLRER